MASGQWREAHRAWKRLGRWLDPRVAGAGSRDLEPDPLDALGDVGQVRRLLDEVELRAVRSARLRRSSWAEIATRLGVTRQSAWERWRDLDDGADTDDAAEPGAAEAAASRTAARLRRSARVVVPNVVVPNVVVPNVVGAALVNACRELESHGLVPVGSDPDAPPLHTLAAPGAVVADQSPEAGASVPPETRVTLWIDRGEGGVREPRHPRPQPLTARKYHEEPSEQVG